MPVISITMGKISSEKKRELIKSLTTKAIEITGIPEQAFACTITELPDENLGLGTRTVQEIKESKA